MSGPASERVGIESASDFLPENLNKLEGKKHSTDLHIVIGNEAQPQTEEPKPIGKDVFRNLIDVQLGQIDSNKDKIRYASELLRRLGRDPKGESRLDKLINQAVAAGRVMTEKDVASRNIFSTVETNGNSSEAVTEEPEKAVEQVHEETLETKHVKAKGLRKTAKDRAEEKDLLIQEAQALGIDPKEVEGKSLTQIKQRVERRQTRNRKLQEDSINDILDSVKEISVADKKTIKTEAEANVIRPKKKGSLYGNQVTELWNIVNSQSQKIPETKKVAAKNTLREHYNLLLHGNPKEGIVAGISREKKKDIEEKLAKLEGKVVEFTAPERRPEFPEPTDIRGLWTLYNNPSSRTEKLYAAENLLTYSKRILDTVPDSQKQEVEKNIAEFEAYIKSFKAPVEKKRNQERGSEFEKAVADRTTKAKVRFNDLPEIADRVQPGDRSPVELNVKGVRVIKKDTGEVIYPQKTLHRMNASQGAAEESTDEATALVRQPSRSAVKIDTTLGDRILRGIGVKREPSEQELSLDTKKNIETAKAETEITEEQVSEIAVKALENALRKQLLDQKFKPAEAEMLLGVLRTTESYKQSLDGRINNLKKSL